MNPLLWERLAPAPMPQLDPDAWWFLQTGVPNDVEHLVALRRQLECEIGVGHPLHGEPFDVLARFAAADEVLLVLTGGRFAIVHPTWSSGQEAPPFPTTFIFADVGKAQIAIDQLEADCR